MKCMNGQVISGTSICVDYWNWTPEKKYIRFLSHLHADHTYNLNSTFREIIYTSKFNAWLAKKWFNINPELVVVLDVGSSHVLNDESTGEYISVTLIDANHCPGSVMFLFQGSFGRILYTGDFRYSPSMLKHPMLKSLIENENLNRLYLDNTFAAEHCEFPSRKEALQEALALIRNHPDHHILIGLRKLGKEEVLLEIALSLKEKVLVSNEKLEILKYLQFKNVFTTDSNQSRILVMNMHQINSSYIQKLKEEKGPVLTILLTALYSVLPPGDKYSKMQEDKVLGIHRIPYSDHSCHSELAEFVSKVKPDTVHPIVKVTVPNQERSADVHNNWFNFLPLSCTWRNSVIPQSILQLCKNPQGCSERNEEVSSCFEDKVTEKKEMVPYQLTEDESKSSASGRSQQGNKFRAQNSTDTVGLKMLLDPTNLELNNLEMCGSASVPRSNEWFSMTDEEITQITDDENICQQQAILKCSNEVHFSAPDGVLSQLEYTSESLVLQPSLHSQLEVRESTNNEINENDTAMEFQEKCDTENSFTVQSLVTDKMRCSTPNTSKYIPCQFTSEPTPIQTLLQVSSISDKERDIDDDKNHITKDSSENVAFPLPVSPQQLSPDLLDLTTIPNGEHFVSKSNSKINATDQTNEIIPVLTHTNNRAAKPLLLSMPPSCKETSFFRKASPTPKPLNPVEPEEKSEESMISYNSLCEAIVSSQINKLNNKIEKTKRNSTFKCNKKVRISEQFKHLLVNSNSNLQSDSFCNAIGSSRNECSSECSSTSTVEEDSLPLEETSYEVDFSDDFYSNLDIALSTWKEGVRSTILKSRPSSNVVPRRSKPSDLQNQTWDDYDWKSIFEENHIPLKKI